MDEQRNSRTPPPSASASASPDGPPPHELRSQGGASGRKAPRWTIAFLRALERTGSPEAAALDSGIDRTTAYQRRKAHPDFADAWTEALRRHKGAADAQVQEEASFWRRVKGKVTATMLGITPDRSAVLGCPTETQDPSTIASSGNRHARPSPGRAARDDPPPHASRREELMATTALGGQMKRVGPGRWTAAAERRFFEELAATNNVRRACAAAGVSWNAVNQRRLKRPDFAAKWEAVAETGRAAIDMHLIETTRKSFNPEELDLGEVQPKVTVAEAIRIVQLHGKKAQKSEIAGAEPPQEDIEAVRKRLFDKLERMRKREMPRMVAEGWAHDPEHDCMVPPGWARAQPPAE